MNFERHRIERETEHQMLKLEIVNINDRKHEKNRMLSVAIANMSLSKQQLAGNIAKKTFSLDEKVKFLDFAKANPTFGCRKLAVAETFKIRKTATANILKEEKTIHNQSELFREKSKKRNRPDKYRRKNEILK